jgi:hypothetical protein
LKHETRAVQGLATTFGLLAKTENEAAIEVLLPALDSPQPAIQEGALVALLHRPGPAGGREILRRVPTMSPRWKSIIGQHHGRMTGALRDAVLDADANRCRNGCQAAVWFREYDLIPTLLAVLQGRGGRHADVAAGSLLGLTERLYDELAGTSQRSDRRDPHLVRRHVVNSLEAAVGHYGQHKRPEVIEAFLLLASRDNVTLKLILQSPRHPALAPVIETLTRSPRKGVIRLLLAYLDDPHVPPGALEAIAHREDMTFLQYLLRKIGREPSSAVAQNLKRMDSIAWLRSGQTQWRELDDAAQHAMVRLLMASSIPRPQVFAVLEKVLVHGKGGGRREAARALAAFPGAAANALAMKFLYDPDPHVQAPIVGQLRGRGLPGILPELVKMVDSPHAVVRKAARESLSEFSFRRYLAAFEMLDEQVRQNTGRLVRKIDPHTVPLLREELHSPMRTRRLRAVAIARLIDVVEPLEPIILDLLEDTDHMVRTAAAAALARSHSTASHRALLGASHDTSEVVRRAARQSLLERGQTVPRDVPSASQG